jgi:hypothetical protein
MKKSINYSLSIMLSILLFSCGSKINRENYDKISNGMSKSQVESILGKGKSQASSSIDGSQFGGSTITTEVVTYQGGASGLKIISITYTNGEVQGKAQSGL